MYNNSIQQPNLSTFLRTAVIAASVLSSSSKAKDTVLLERILTNLHQCRRQYPQNERQICHAIFKIHDMAYYGPSDFMRQRASVSTICGFSIQPTKDMSVTKKLLDRMALVKNIHDMHPTFQTIIPHTLQIYKDQNYQQNDTDLSVAYRIKGLIQMMADASVKKNAPDQHWLHENAAQLAQIHPKMQSFADQFPAVTPKRRPSLYLDNPRFLAEAPNAFSKTRSSRNVVKSLGDD